MRSAIAFALLVSTAACGPSSVSERRSLEELRPRIGNAERTNRERLELEVIDHDSASVRTLLIDHSSPTHVPVAALRFLRWECVDGAETEWPRGWVMVAGGNAYGSHTDGMQADVRYRDRVHVVRTSIESPAQLDVRRWSATSGSYGATRAAESNWVTVQFDGVAHPLVASDFDTPKELLVSAMIWEVGATPMTLSVRPDGTWEGPHAHGVLDPAHVEHLRGALRDARVWSLLGGEDAEWDDARDGPYPVVVAVAHGSGFAKRRVEFDAFINDPGWTAIREEIERLTGEDLLR